MRGSAQSGGSALSLPPLSSRVSVCLCACLSTDTHTVRSQARLLSLTVTYCDGDEGGGNVSCHCFLYSGVTLNIWITWGILFFNLHLYVSVFSLSLSILLVGYPSLRIEKNDLRSVTLLEAKAKVKDIAISRERVTLKDVLHEGTAAHCCPLWPLCYPPLLLPRTVPENIV